MTSYTGHLDGKPAVFGIGPHGLDAGGRIFAWVEMDGLAARGHTIELSIYDATLGAQRYTISLLGPRFDAFLADLAEARSRARRAALLQWTGEPELRAFTQAPESPDDDPVALHVFADGFTAEPRTGVPDLVPFGLVTDIARDGYRITVQRRGLPEITVRRLGSRTDEFEQVIARCRAADTAATAAAFAEFDDRLTGLSAPHGWAITAAEAGAFGGALADAFAAGPRAEEIGILAGLAPGGLRYGISLQPEAPLPFVLAVGRGAVAVESVAEDEARATYVFATADADAVNRALIMLSFRREAVYLPAERLGRWTLAARTLPIVQWARSVFAARVIHDDNWRSAITAALR